MEFAAQIAFEIVSTLIAAAALVYAALAFSASKKAIEAFEKSNVAALQVKAQDTVSDAKRSFLSLQEACSRTRREWDAHNMEQFPTIGSSFGKSFFEEPQETQHISTIERVGSKSLDELLASFPECETARPEEWPEFIAKAQSTSTGIERLKLRLEGPKPRRF